MDGNFGVKYIYRLEEPIRNPPTRISVIEAINLINLFVVMAQKVWVCVIIGTKLVKLNFLKSLAC